MPGLTVFPPWPESVPAHPLLVIDYQRIKAGEEDEIDTLWKAATDLGFWYLKNHGVEEEVDGMFDMGAEVMGLPLEEKMLYEQGDDGISHGYKAAGASATDETGALDSVEFFNVSKDDALAWPVQVHRAYPPAVAARIPDVVIPFVRKSVEVNRTLISVLGDRLGLPDGAILRRHRTEEHSGCETRCIRSPPRPEGMIEDRAALGAHTDFGSLSFLHNRMGGLQVLVPGSNQWQWAKPIPGHAICNLGDAMTILSGGILRSNLHRIVPHQQNYTFHSGPYEPYFLFLPYRRLCSTPYHVPYENLVL
ncbi:Clavaminate synthase-like protein [Amylocystis lapponica]|nr:Clavaminate synthase-like protein [Amylocystis lapponica]